MLLVLGKGGKTAFYSGDPFEITRKIVKTLPLDHKKVRQCRTEKINIDY